MYRDLPTCTHEVPLSHYNVMGRCGCSHNIDVNWEHGGLQRLEVAAPHSDNFNFLSALRGGGRLGGAAFLNIFLVTIHSVDLTNHLHVYPP